jgi:protein TonB
MDTRKSNLARHSVRGAVRPVFIAVIAILVAVGAAAWVLIIKPNREAVEQATVVVSPGSKAAAAQAPPSNVESLSVDQLLAEARKSMNEQRMLAPAGNNAFEFYLKALEKQPGNQVAADALRETFPFGATTAEQAINQRDFNEAQREIDLLAKADPENYTLTILRSKLDAQRKLLDREQQLVLDQQHKQQADQAQSAVAAKQLAADQERAALQQAQAARTAQQQQAQQQAEATKAPPKPVAAVAKPAEGDSSLTEALLVKQTRPRYPTAAMRANQEGWVDVEFTVDAQGAVGGVNIIDAQPKHVFDRAALDAVARWEFRPATRNGEPLPVTMRRRIEFKLH